MNLDEAYQQAAAAIRQADALFIGAGAGMSVDSGLPDFRGNEGFWNAYPPFRGRRLAEVSNPRRFRLDAEEAWGFFGHRLQLYQNTAPHEGHAILRRWAENRPGGYFVFTSNTDGHFQRAGFDAQRLVECHGTFEFLQCSRNCRRAIWQRDGTTVSIDETTMRALQPLPACPHCGQPARPNVLMFGDREWIDDYVNEQLSRVRKWLYEIREQRLVVIELGAGLAVPTVRMQCESLGGTLIRVNPVDYESPLGGIDVPAKSLDALRGIDQHLA